MVDTEKLTQEIGRELFNLVKKEVRPVVSSHWWKEKGMTWIIKDESLRARALGFVDVYPALATKNQKVQHFKEYFGREIPGIAVPMMDLVIQKMAQHFITGATLEEISKTIKKIEKMGACFTLNSLGEAILSESEAESYTTGYISLIGALKSSRDRNYSVKPSSLYSQFDPIDFEGSVSAVQKRYRRILRKAKEVGAFLNLDSEPYYFLDLVQEIFMRTLSEEEFRDLDKVGMVLQAYLLDSEARLRKIIEWAKRRGSPITLRLVKGAYWDTEVILAKQKGWSIPVFTQKWQTDLNFEKLADLILKAYPAVKLATGSHNIRSVAHAIAKAMALGLPKNALEIQVLWGMGDPLMKAILKMGYPGRVYLTIGNLVEGMGYLARRIIENTSQESFLRQSFGYNLPVQDLLRSPEEVTRCRS